jgi:UDP-N-acetylglucosamine acyltransferase
MADVHATAVVEPGAVLADDVEVGPLAIVERGAVVSAGCRLQAHSIVRAHVELGPHNVVFPFAVIGGEPQARRRGEGPPRVVTGADNVFREHVTVHGGTGGRVTRIGHGNLLMAGAHVAHDVELGSGCVLANAVQLAGHAVVEDGVTFGGLSGVTQHVRVGEGAFVAATAACERDVPPFVVVQGDRARVRGVNVVGLRRRGVPEESIRALQRAVHALWLSRVPLSDAARSLADDQDPYVRRLLAALEAPSPRR